MGTVHCIMQLAATGSDRWRWFFEPAVAKVTAAQACFTRQLRSFNHHCVSKDSVVKSICEYTAVHLSPVPARQSVETFIADIGATGVNCQTFSCCWLVSRHRTVTARLMTMGPYDEFLQQAESLGFAPQAHSDNPTQALKDILDLVKQNQLVHDRQLRLGTLNLYLGSKTLTDKQALEQRSSNMTATTTTLNNVCLTKDSLADRLRSAKMRPSVPVAPEYQQDFSDLLQHSASSADMLHDGVTALQWAASMHAKPSVWEDQLKCILEVAKEVNSCMTAMEDFSAALISSSDSSKSS